MKKILLLLLFPISLFSWITNVPYMELFVDKIHSGDSFNGFLRDGTRVEVRMWGIDAPELDQDFGIEAYNHLASKISNTVVEVAFLGRDPYKRTIGMVYFMGSNANLWMVANGFAWVHDIGNKNISEMFSLRGAQLNAITRKIGLWAYGTNIMSPMKYRELQFKKKN